MVVKTIDSEMPFKSNHGMTRWNRGVALVLKMQFEEQKKD
jgi:hypothetical protein